jgi:uncharacterized membrane protein YvlD (DUF360 family)
MKFIIKWILNGIIVTPLLMWYADVSFLTAFVTASVLTIIAYLLGDQLVLRSTNNTVATIADFILAAVFLGLASYLLDWDLTFWETVTISAIVGVAEWVYHRYVLGDEQVARYGRS